MTKKPVLVDIPAHLQTGHVYDNVIGVGDQIDPESVVNYAFSYKLRQIVQTSSHDHELELKTSELMLKDPDKYLAFPVSSILDPDQVGPEREAALRSYSKSFTRAKEKNVMIDELREHCLAITKSERLVADICLAADELITNAIYNAPHVRYAKNGPGAPRTSQFGEATDLKPGQVFVGQSGSRLVLGCADSYGTLNPSHLIERLKSCFDKGVEQSMNYGTGGAGIGTFLIFQSAISLYLGVTENKQTVICCTFSLERRAKARAALPKNLHICSDRGTST